MARQDTRALMQRVRIALAMRALGRAGWPALLAVLLILSYAAASHAGGQQRALAAPMRRGWEGRASAPKLPAVLRFSDVERGTTYMVWLQDVDDVKAGTFVFTLRDQRQLKGLEPITQLADGSITQGQAKFSPAASTSCSARIVTPATEDPANVFLSGHIDASGIVAYAQVQYLDCRFEQAGQGVLESGCTPSGCADVLGQAGTTVQNYDTSLIAAAARRDQDAWTKVYGQVSLTTRGQYSPEQFAALLNQQIASVGQITAISPMSEAPTIDYDTGGQAFFTVKQQITYSHNGASTTREVTSYYLLEAGQWVFWFSA